MTRQASMGEWLKRAYEDGECPPPEAYLADELAALDKAARERLDAHAATCAACAAERDLAAGFDASATAEERRDVERIVRRLERRPPHGRRPGWGWGSLSWTDLVRTPAFQLAAAAVLVIGVGLGVREAATPPTLGTAPDPSAVRSSTLELLSPVGELAGLPDALRWQEVEGAELYRVSVLAVDDSELWSAETTRPSIEIDERLGAAVRPAVWYRWRVEALDRAGSRIAWSPEARFRVAPSGS